MSRKDQLRTLEDIYIERVKLIVNAQVSISDDDWEESLELEEKLKVGVPLTPKELDWVNQTIEKYELE